MRILASTDDGSLREIVFNTGTDTSVLESLKPFYHKTLLRKASEKRINKIYVLSRNVNAETKVVFFQNDGSIELKSFKDITENDEENIKDTEEVVASKAKKGKDATKDGKFVQPTPKSYQVLQNADTKSLDEITGMFDDSRLESLQTKSKKRALMHDEFVSFQVLKSSIPTLCIGTRSGLIHIIQIDNDKLNFVATHEVKAPMDFLQYNDTIKEDCDTHILGYGGEENLIKLIEISPDFKKMDQIWEAKNVKNDKLDLKIPIWPTSMYFKSIDDNKNISEKLDDTKLNYEFTEVTKTGFIRHYKTQHGKKPMDNVDIIHDRPFQRQQWPTIISTQFTNKETSLNGNCTTEFNETTHIIMGDSRKNLLKIDAVKGELKGKYGNGDIYGVTTSLRVCDDKYLVCGGIDGYLRIYDITTRTRIGKIYCNFKVLECILLDDSEVETVQSLREARKLEKKRKLTEDEQEEENDKLWDDLESQSSKKKQKN